MAGLEDKIVVFKSNNTNPVSNLDKLELSLQKQSTSNTTPKSIIDTTFTRFENEIDKETLIEAYSNNCKLVYGSKTDEMLLKHISQRVSNYNRSFNYSLVLSNESTPIILKDVLEKEQLFSGDLLESFIEDVNKDIKNYLQVTGENECVLRLVLEDYSSLYDLLHIESGFSKEKIWHSVRDYIINLGYQDSFVFHIDDYAINFSKIYCGAPSLCMSTSLDQANQAGYFNRWVECFNQPLNFHDALTESIFAKDIELSIDLISQLASNINNFQLNPGHILEDTNTYQFEAGTPHFYFGLENELNREALLMHARPMVWARDFYAKRFLILLEPTSKFNHPNFFK